MTTTINLTGLQNATTVVDLVNFANQQTDNLIGGFFIIAIFFVITVALVRKGYDFLQTVSVASFVCLVLSVFGRYMGFVSVYFVLFLIVMLAVFVSILFLRKE